MHVLMIGQLTGKEYTELLQEEGADIDKARAEGLVQDFFMKADRSGPVLILADVSADQARERMAACHSSSMTSRRSTTSKWSPRQQAPQPTSNTRPTAPESPSKSVRLSRPLSAPGQ